ncbi:unnamed protein product [Amoebophrya sp. A120]|nr:unnamed protein product [Amoebophrya sp. A120]|eukprot:GSA120T00008656001.1
MASKEQQKMAEAIDLRIRKALEIMNLEVDQATVEFFASCINLESTLDEWVDIIGPFVEEAVRDHEHGPADDAAMRTRCEDGYQAFLRFDPITAGLNQPNPNMQQGGGSSKQPGQTKTATSMGPVVVDGLEKWLKELRLEHYLTAAQNWCREMGAADYLEILEEAQQFAADLKMKPLEAKRINEYLKQHRGKLHSAVGSHSSNVSMGQSAAGGGARDTAQGGGAPGSSSGAGTTMHAQGGSQQAVGGGTVQQPGGGGGQHQMNPHSANPPSFNRPGMPPEMEPGVGPVGNSPDTTQNSSATSAQQAGVAVVQQGSNLPSGGGVAGANNSTTATGNNNINTGSTPNAQMNNMSDRNSSNPNPHHDPRSSRGPKGGNSYNQQQQMSTADWWAQQSSTGMSNHHAGPGQGEYSTSNSTRNTNTSSSSKYNNSSHSDYQSSRGGAAGNYNPPGTPTNAPLMGGPPHGGGPYNHRNNNSAYNHSPNFAPIHHRGGPGVSPRQQHLSPNIMTPKGGGGGQAYNSTTQGHGKGPVSGQPGAVNTTPPSSASKNFNPNARSSAGTNQNPVQPVQLPMNAHLQVPPNIAGSGPPSPNLPQAAPLSPSQFAALSPAAQQQHMQQMHQQQRGSPNPSSSSSQQMSNAGHQQQQQNNNNLQPPPGGTNMNPNLNSPPQQHNSGGGGPGSNSAMNATLNSAAAGQPQHAVPKILADVTVQRTVTPQNDGPRLCFGDARDPYVQAEELGAGAMATVYRCYRKSKPEECFAAKVISLKRLKLNHSGFSREYSKLQREAQILSTLRNKYITSLVDVIEQRDNLYLVMEIVPHGELFDRILDHDNEPYIARFSEPEARYVFVQIAAGLKYVHMKQIVHRDLKPENILVCKRYPLIKAEELAGDPRWNQHVECDHNKTRQMVAYEIKLSDFGLAKLVADGYSIATTRTGTPQYWAPEVATSLGATRTTPSEQAGMVQGYGFSADLWSLGVVLYVLLCGRYPFTGDARTMEQNQIRGYFEFPKKCALSNEAKYLITGLIRRLPNARISLLNCLRCKWATKSMIHMKCAFYRPRVPQSHWKSRNILLPLLYERTTAYIMSAVFRAFPIGMDPSVVFLRSDAFPPPPATELSENDIMRNVGALDKFKNAMIRFVNDNFLEDSFEYEIDSYGDRYFYFNFKYMPEVTGGDDQVMVRGNVQLPNNGQPVQPTVVTPHSHSPNMMLADQQQNGTGEFVDSVPYERPEDPVAHEVIYTVMRQIFPAKILELVTLRVRDSVNPNTGELRPSCGMQLEQAGQIGLFVRSLERDSPMRGKLFVGDLLLEVQGKPLTTMNIFEIYCLTGSCILVQRGA